MDGPQVAQDEAEGPSVPRLLEQAREGDPEALGELLHLYRNYLTVLATTQLDRRLRRRVNPSDLVQDAMLAAYCDFAKFRGGSERELLAWLRQILINCLHHVIETHVRAKMRDLRREISVEQVSATSRPLGGTSDANDRRPRTLAERPDAAARAGGGPGRSIGVSARVRIAT